MGGGVIVGSIDKLHLKQIKILHIGQNYLNYHKRSDWYMTNGDRIRQMSNEELGGSIDEG